MLTLTAPGVDAGLVWDRAHCSHSADVACSGPRGCRVDPVVGALWNDASRKYWRELNRVCKQHADRELRRMGAESFKGHVLAYQWELQARGLWHLHFVVGVETPHEAAWASVYVQTMRRLAPAYLFGYVDAKPLKRPRPAELCAAYIAKYLTKRQRDGSFGATETVFTAGRTLLTYVSRQLTGQTGVTMRALRDVRLLWAYREGHLPIPQRSLGELQFASGLLAEPAAYMRSP